MRGFAILGGTPRASPGHHEEPAGSASRFALSGCLSRRSSERARVQSKGCRADSDDRRPRAQMRAASPDVLYPDLLHVTSIGAAHRSFHPVGLSSSERGHRRYGTCRTRSAGRFLKVCYRRDVAGHRARAVHGAARPRPRLRARRRLPSAAWRSSTRSRCASPSFRDATNDLDVIARALAAATCARRCSSREASSATRQARPRRCSTTRLRARAWCSRADGTSRVTARTSSSGSSRRS